VVGGHFVAEVPGVFIADVVVLILVVEVVAVGTVKIFPKTPDIYLLYCLDL